MILRKLSSTVVDSDDVKYWNFGFILTSVAAVFLTSVAFCIPRIASLNSEWNHGTPCNNSCSFFKELGMIPMEVRFGGFPLLPT